MGISERLEHLRESLANHVPHPTGYTPTLKDSYTLIVKTDLELIYNACNMRSSRSPNLTWLEDWKEHGWWKPSNRPVKNADMWKVLEELLGLVKEQLGYINVKIEWAGGHADDYYGNMKAYQSAREGAFERQTVG